MKKRRSAKGRQKKRYFLYCKVCDRFLLVKEFSNRWNAAKISPCQECNESLRECTSYEAKRAKRIFPWKPKWKSGKTWYEEYLASDLWQTIRGRVLARDGSECQICHVPATVVHHKSYDQTVIAGYRDDLLVSLCRACHQAIEFDADGRKRTLVEANATLDRGQAVVR